jgi:D-Tyr-tRNAtyr deacylase
MLSMMDNQEVGDYDIGKLAKKLEEVRILSCEKRPLNKEIRNYAISWLKYNKYTLAMDIKDEDDNTQIFMKSLGKGRYEYSLVNYESDETDIIYIVGRVTLKDIKSLTD